MKKYVIFVLIVLSLLGGTYFFWSKNAIKTQNQIDETFNNVPVTKADNKEYFNLESLNQDLVAFANEAYKNADKNNKNPDYYDGIPPFQFYKRIDCQVVDVDKDIQKRIKKYPETVSFHTIILLKDSLKNLYDFTLTSTTPDKTILRLQNYGPLTNENPEVVNLPINQRRLKEFPIDFNTNKALEDKDGRCVYIPYPIISDQTFWLFGNDIHNSAIQALYRNDRFKSVDEFVNLVARNLD